jgi:hypothetical protein
MLKTLRIVLILGLLLGGCSLKTPVISSKPYYVLIKNKHFALNDTGFLNFKAKEKNIQVFSAGSVILNLQVEDKRVCVNSSCMKKIYFNQEFFGFKHYASFIDDMLLFKPIYKGKNLHKLQNGFEQRLVAKKYDIFYKVDGKTLYFKDKKNGVLMKLNELGE